MKLSHEHQCSGTRRRRKKIKLYSTTDSLSRSGCCCCCCEIRFFSSVVPKCRNWVIQYLYIIASSYLTHHRRPYRAPPSPPIRSFFSVYCKRFMRVKICHFIFFYDIKMFSLTINRHRFLIQKWYVPKECVAAAGAIVRDAGSPKIAHAYTDILIFSMAMRTVWYRFGLVSRRAATPMSTVIARIVSRLLLKV